MRGGEEVVSYVAHDGEVVALCSAAAPLGPSDVRVEVELTTLGSWTAPTGTAVEPLGDTFVGRIVECGADIDPARQGTRVLGIMRCGGASSHLVVPSFSAHPCAESSPAGIVAVMTTSGLVACCLDQAVEVEPGSVAAITSAGTGVSCVLAGLLRARGVRPIGLRAHSGEHTALLASGCVAVLGPEHRPLEQSLPEVADGRLADLVIDASRVPLPWAEVVSLLSPAGRAVTWVAPDRLDWDPQRSTSLGVVTELSRRFASSGGDVVASLSVHIRRLTAEAVAGRLSIPVHEFTPATAQAAYDLLGDPALIGRVAIRFTPGP